MTPDRLVEIRKKELKLTQQALAEAVGCGRRMLVDYERGHAPIPRLFQLALMAVKAGLPIE